MEEKICILHIDSNQHDHDIIKNILLDSKTEFTVKGADNRDKLTECLAAGGIDVVLSEITLPGFGELELLKFIRENHRCVVLIILTSSNSVENAIQALKMGVADYIVKSDHQFQNRAQTIRTALLSKKSVNENNTKKEKLHLSEISHRMLLEKMMDGFAMIGMNGFIRASLMTPS